MKRLNPAALLIVIASVGVLVPAAAAPVSITEAQPEPSRIPMLRADDRESLLEHYGQLVILTGVVSSAEWSGTGRVMIIEFEGAARTRGAMAVVFENQRNRFDEAFLGNFSETVLGRQVRLDGRLQEYGGYSEEHKGRPQIILNSTEQVTIVPRQGEVLPTTRPATRQGGPSTRAAR